MFVPVILTLLPPKIGPEEGETAVTVGTFSYVKSSAELVALVPPGVVTVIFTVAAVLAGDTAVIEVLLFTTKLLAAFVPNFTAVAPVKFVPVILTEVLPVVGPAFGETFVTVGA